MEKQYYIIAGESTHKKDKLISLLKKNSLGVVCEKSLAGVFSEEFVNNIRREDLIPIEKEKADKVFFKVNYENEHYSSSQFLSIPNITSIRRELGVTLKQFTKGSCSGYFNKSVTWK